MEEEAQQTPFSQALDSLTEKKRTTRIEGLKKIYGLLQNYSVIGSELEENQFSMREGINSGLKGSEEEKIWACQLLSIYSITIGTESSELIPLYFPTLSKISVTASPSLLGHAVTAQTFLLFVGGGEAETEEFLDQLKKLMEKSSESVLSTIIFCWSFLLTTIPNAKISEAILPDSLNIIFSIMRSSSNTDVRIATGDAIALLVNIHRDYLLNKEEEFDIYDLDGYISVEELLEVMDDLKTEKERKISVKNQKHLKKSFKTIYKGVVEYMSPSEQIKINNSILTFDTWTKIVQIRFFRLFLNSGLFVHLLNNDLFSQIFEYDLDFDTSFHKSVAPAARELYRKQVGKERSKDRKKFLQNSVQNQLQNNNNNNDYS